MFKAAVPPSLKHPLGTERSGRDVLALLFTGIKYSLLLGTIAGGVDGNSLSFSLYGGV